MTPFCAEYLRAQGVQVLEPAPRERTQEVKKREAVFVPVVPMYERGDI